MGSGSAHPRGKHGRASLRLVAVHARHGTLGALHHRLATSRNKRPLATYRLTPKLPVICFVLAASATKNAPASSAAGGP